MEPTLEMRRLFQARNERVSIFTPPIKLSEYSQPGEHSELRQSELRCRQVPANGRRFLMISRREAIPDRLTFDVT